MPNVFKINLFCWKDIKEKKSVYQDYCIEHNILGWGWTRGENPSPVETLDEYKEDYINNKNEGKKLANLTKACNQAKEMREGDFCWTYAEGQWYLGKIGGGFCFRPPDKEYPAFGMYRKCEWTHIEEYDLVPGNVCVRSKSDGTLKCVSEKENFYIYCKDLYNGKKASQSLGLDFWELAHYEDLEDLVGLYLQKQEGYFVIPSTNKTGTKDYEYKLIQNGSPHREAVIQCKNNDNISPEVWGKFETGDYQDLNVYILTVKEDTHPEGDEKNYKKSNDIFAYTGYNGRIKVFNKDKLKNWAQDNIKILPQRVQKFLELSKKS